MKKRLFFPVFSGLALLLLAQCGLERGVVAWSIPPVGTYAESTEVFSFRTAADHDDDGDRLFLGYEIYYKLSQTNNFPSNLSNANELIANGFKKLHLASDTWDPPSPSTVPVVAVNDASKGEEYQILVDFTLLNQMDTQPSIYIDPLVSPPLPWSAISVRRDVQDNSENPNKGSYKYFYWMFAGDADLTDPQIITEGIPYPAIDGVTTLNPWIALYVYAYGVSMQSSTFYQEIKSPLRFLPARQIQTLYESGNL